MTDSTTYVGELTSVTFVIEGAIDTQITLTEQADGSLKVDLVQLGPDLIGDLRGFFFDIGDENLLKGMSVSGADVTGSAFKADKIKKVSSSANVNGEVTKTYGAFDGGVELGTQGIGKDDVRDTSFVISSTKGDVTIADFAEMDFGLRYMSVGEEGGSREGSLKIGGSSDDFSDQLGSLGDRVWLDDDRDGVQDAGEVGVGGITVELIKNGAATGVTVTTDAQGYYLFDGLEAADYAIQISDVPFNYVVTLQNLAGEAADSDVNGSGLSDTFALGVGEDLRDVDAGLFDLTSLVVAPEVQDDAFGTCWNVAPTVDVLANDDADLTITAINGVAVAAGDSVTTAEGATVTLNADGTLTYDGVDAFAGLAFGTMGTDQFTYTAENETGGEATATVDFMVGANNIKTLEDINEVKPDLVEFTVTDMSDMGGLFEVDVVAPGFERFEVTDSTLVYCVDIDGDVLSGVTLTSELYLADENDASLGEYVVNYENLDLVTYILNQDYSAEGYTQQDIQTAIWNLTDDYLDGFLSFFDPEAEAIVNDAIANGEGFEAGEGDLVGLILAPQQEVDPVTGEDTTNYQNFIYGVEYESFAECLCV